jgi:hypothetical protein
MVLGRALGMRFLWTDWTERDPRTVVWTRGCHGRLAGERQLLVEVEGVADDSRGATEEGMAEESASMGLTMSTILKWT